jgi:endonuclease YncB( thermonuclease family)
MTVTKRALFILSVAAIVLLGSTANAFAPTGRATKPIGSKTASKAGASTTTKLFGAKGAVGKQPANIWSKHILPAITSVTGTIGAALTELSFLQKSLFVSIFLLGFWAGRIPLMGKSYRDVQEIPNKLFGASAPTLRGRAVSVSDGDTIRFYHTPLWWQKPPEKMKVSAVALPIRVCTIDTPETAKFGKPGQPFGLEAKAELKEFLEGNVIKIRLLQKDQYGRGVAQVTSGGTDVDEFMLKKGMAEVYLGGGAVYGPKGKDAYVEMQNEAKKKKLGIWSSGKRESAAEYKKRTK